MEFNYESSHANRHATVVARYDGKFIVTEDRNMGQAEFSVHLGGGLYMDSNGVLSHGPEPGKPVYPTPGGGLPVNLETLEKVFQGMAKALPNKDDPKSREKFDKILHGIGMTDQDKENLIGLLQAVGGVASVIGSVVPIVGAALAILTLLLGLFKEGPSALELLITRRFDELERKIKFLEIQGMQRDLRTQRSVISAALAALANYVVELKNTSPDEATLLLRQHEMRGQVEKAGVAVRNLLDVSMWLASFEEKEHKWVWPWIAHRLFTFPKAAPPQRALFPAQNAPVFDHRLMVPLAIFGVTAYLTVLRASAPEFRSTRENREDLWEFADALERLAENMRREGLARTLYTAADFQGGPGGGIPWGLAAEEVIDLSIFGQPPYLAPGNTRFAVGALDLRSHDDVYFTPGFTASSIQHPGPQFARQGLLNVRWMPPAKLERYEQPVLTLGWEPPNQPPRTQRRYRITNPEECAQAANAQAEQDYADLLYSSGYLNLIHLVATLRNEATDPDHSQTVRTEAWLRRKPGPSAAVVVESQPILLTGVISAAAERQPQQYKATTWFTTQPLGRDRKLQYRVWLRTLSTSFYPFGGSWESEQEYRLYHQVGYTNDPEHPGCQKLFTSTGSALDELKIAEGTSIPESRHEAGTAVLKAITYDWWIPVKPLGRAEITLDPSVSIASLRAAGWEAGGNAISPPALPTREGGVLPPRAPSAGIADFSAIRDIQLSDLIGWEDAKEPSKGQRRLAQQGEICLDYTLHWQADKMTISLKNNRPADRNYVVYVVVEEKLGSGAVLHTVERIPIIGQLTFVPQSFFDQEFEAHARTASLFRELARRYAKSLRDIPRPGGPGDPDPVTGRAIGLLGLDRQLLASDPVLRELHLNNFSVQRDFERLATIASQHPPAAMLLRQILSEANVPQTMVQTLLESASGYCEDLNEKPTD
jgi:hypothetical protein